MNPGEDVLMELKRSEGEFRSKVRHEALEALYSIIDEELEWGTVGKTLQAALRS